MQLCAAWMTDRGCENETCRNVHPSDRETALVEYGDKQTNTICNYYRQGGCARPNCAFLHVAGQPRAENRRLVDKPVQAASQLRGVCHDIAVRKRHRAAPSGYDAQREQPGYDARVAQWEQAAHASIRTLTRTLRQSAVELGLNEAPPADEPGARRWH